MKKVFILIELSAYIFGSYIIIQNSSLWLFVGIFIWSIGILAQTKLTNRS